MDNIAKFCKMTVFERRGDRVLVLLSSGNLAGTQAVIGVLNQRCADAGIPNLWNARTMFDVARLVADAMRDIERRDGAYLQENEVGFNASFIVGGQIAASRCACSASTPRATSSRRRRHALPADRRDQVRQADHRPRRLARDAARGRHQVRPGVVRLDDAQQPVGRDADRSHLLRARQLRGDQAPALRRGRRVFQRAEPRLERWHAQGLSGACASWNGDPVDAPSPFVVTCEHGGNRIPAAYRRHFEDRDALLNSHRGYDAGALVMAKALARALAAPLVASTTSRLLVDLNRSIGHPRLHSEATRRADVAVRARIVERHYRPYRDKVDRAIERAIAQARSRDPHLVAQLHARARRRGPERGRRAALRSLPRRRA
jgi:hypothetical protein